MTSETYISVNATRTGSEHMSEFPQFFYRHVNGSLVCKKVFDSDSAAQLRQQGFKLSAELWPAVTTAKVETPLSAEPAA